MEALKKPKTEPNKNRRYLTAQGKSSSLWLIGQGGIAS